VQEQEFEGLGSTRTIQVNVRLIAATHRDLRAMIQQESFVRIFLPIQRLSDRDSSSARAAGGHSGVGELFCLEAIPPDAQVD
jgi:hypothetical protein